MLVVWDEIGEIEADPGQRSFFYFREHYKFKMKSIKSVNDFK